MFSDENKKQRSKRRVIVRKKDPTIKENNVNRNKY